MPHCQHNGYHSGQGRYNHESSQLRYVVVCDDCESELSEIARESYRPQFNTNCAQPA